MSFDDLENDLNKAIYDVFASFRYENEEYLNTLVNTTLLQTINEMLERIFRPAIRGFDGKSYHVPVREAEHIVKYFKEFKV